MAKENGAGTVAITQFAKSPITKTADHILLTAGKELPFDGGSVAGKMAYRSSSISCSPSLRPGLRRKRLTV
ncbi:hypothetical protein RAC89_14035 [Paenibacillus sp. GD4]|uniref:hypothetical protein n=1 Tax=Paenibacillus sp. GD4 TaxID=3068890 RepID=UPI002796C8C0|nr:hypothetical protein [Paenibacillus sp. GD4]MDQ1911548.1 hypothetical protein [Paenibacillus sp. GD4]